MNITEAQEAIDTLWKETNTREGMDCLKNLQQFVNDVDKLLTHNSIKQTPALFKPPQ